MIRGLECTEIWIRHALYSLVRGEEGQDMIEYSLLIVLITIPLLVAIIGVGPFIQNLFQDVANSLATP